NGKIGSLCSSDRNETCCGTEEKAFHHLHRDLQVSLSWEGSARQMPKHPGRTPTVPRETTRFLFSSRRCGRGTPTGRPGDAPLRLRSHLNGGTCTDNGKTAESQAQTSLFGRVLHKWHSRFPPAEAFHGDTHCQAITTTYG